MSTIPWADYLIPLPQEIAVSGEVRWAPGQIGLTTPKGVSQMVAGSVKELRYEYRSKCGSDPSGETFVIHIGKLSEVGAVIGDCDDAEARLRKTPHSEQAYIIRPAANGGLVVAGLEDRGVFYGVQTLRQLLTARLCETEVVVPLVTITDWPDFEERGLWNSGLRSPAHLPWMAGLKLNFEHINHPLDFDPDSPRCPSLPMGDIDAARSRAIHVMPHCWHYDFWSDSSEMRRNYPELVGKGASARNPVTSRDPGYHPDARCPCASSLLLKKLLTEWMESAAQQGVSEISLWLTEYQPSTCGCGQCSDEGSHQLVRETRESIHAIRDAQQAYPNLVVRLFLTFNVLSPDEERACREAISLVPKDESIRVEVVYGLQGPFEDYAQAGNWVSNYGIGIAIGGSYRSRGSLRLRYYLDPRILQERIEYLRDAGYDGLYNISVIATGGEGKGEVERCLCDFHISALAEWFWNASGRDAGQFVRAWVTTRDYAQPDQAAKWIEKMRPVESGMLVAMNALPQIFEAIENGEALRSNGSSVLKQLPDEECLDEMIRTANLCELKAEEMDAPDMVAEARCVGASLRILREVHSLLRALAGSDREPGIEALGKVSVAIEAVVAAARAQTTAWTTMPPTVAEQFDQHTADYWNSVERSLLGLVS